VPRAQHGDMSRHDTVDDRGGRPEQRIRLPAFAAFDKTLSAMHMRRHRKVSAEQPARIGAGAPAFPFPETRTLRGEVDTMRNGHSRCL
jgi:hypothetical protein